MIGTWKLQPLEEKFELQLFFDGDPKEAREFNWTACFDWENEKEPNAKFKAAEKTGFFIWQK